MKLSVCRFRVGCLPGWLVFAGLLPGVSGFGAAPVTGAGFSGEASRAVEPAAAPGVRFFVAPDGSDANSGTAASPFASLERARDAIRELRRAGPWPVGGVRVEVRGGRYGVERTFHLTAEDSGRPDAPVVYAAHPGERPVLSGGVSLTGFRPVTDPGVLARLPEGARGRVQFVDLAVVGLTNLAGLQLGAFGSGRGFVTHPQIELFFNDEAMALARWPNEGFVKMGAVQGPETLAASWGGIRGTPEGRFRFDDARLDRWREDPDIWLYGYWYWDWADSYEQVESIDFDAREITLAKPWHRYGYRTGQRFKAVNLLSEIDEPGEWYLDRRQGRLYFLPPAPLAGARVELSVIPFRMAHLEQVSHVRLEGLTWELGGADGLLIEGGERCVVAGCTVRKLGGNGVEIRGGRGHELRSSDVHTLGRGGAVIRGGNRKTLEPGGHLVENCLFHSLSRIDRTYTPAVWLDGVGNRLANNEMRHIPSSAIRLEGNDHLIELNEIHHVVLESDDQGALDMWGNATYRGNVIRHNHWHHIGNWDGRHEELHIGAAGIRLDDAICGVHIQGNIFHRCASGSVGFGAVQIHGGKENRIENNLFSENRAALSLTAWNAPRWVEFVKNALEHPAIDPALYLERYPELRRLTEDANHNTFSGNLIHRTDRVLLRDPGVIEQTDNRIVEVLEGVRLDDAGRLQLPRTAAERARFQLPDIPFERIGLQPDRYRPRGPSRTGE